MLNAPLNLAERFIAFPFIALEVPGPSGLFTPSQMNIHVKESSHLLLHGPHGGGLLEEAVQNTLGMPV